MQPTSFQTSIYKERLRKLNIINKSYCNKQNRNKRETGFKLPNLRLVKLTSNKPNIIFIIQSQMVIFFGGINTVHLSNKALDFSRE